MSRTAETSKPSSAGPGRSHIDPPVPLTNLPLRLPKPAADALRARAKEMDTDVDELVTQILLNWLAGERY